MNNENTDGLGLLIHDLARLFQRQFEARASGHGLSAAQWRLLVQLKKEEGIAQARLAALLEIEPISVSRLLDRMEESGWIERRADPNDRRVRSVYPTAQTRKVFDAVKAVAGEIYTDALGGLSQDECNTVIRGLRRMTENLTEAERNPCAEKHKPWTSEHGRRH